MVTQVTAMRYKAPSYLHAAPETVRETPPDEFSHARFYYLFRVVSETSGTVAAPQRPGALTKSRARRTRCHHGSRESGE